MAAVWAIPRFLTDNPYTRLAVQIGGALIAGALIVQAILRRDRKIQRYRDAERDRAHADDIRDRVRVDRARRMRSPAPIIYRD